MHFCDFEVNPGTKEEQKEALGLLMLAVHGYNAKRAPADRVAVAFPQYQAGTVDQAPQPGSCLRVICREPGALEAFGASHWPLRLLRLGVATVTAVQPVPQHAVGMRVVRDRGFERNLEGSSYQRRQVARAAARGQAAQPAPAVKLGRSFGLPLRSASTGKAFYLDVRVEPMATPGPWTLDDISAYGLCGPGAAVPVF